MYIVGYYATSSGKQPVLKWINSLDNTLSADVFAKLKLLEEKGLELLGTVLRKITGSQDTYEIRTNRCRIITYYDSKNSTFLLFHGFRKQKNIERRQVSHGVKLIKNYLG